MECLAEYKTLNTEQAAEIGIFIPRKSYFTVTIWELERYLIVRTVPNYKAIMEMWKWKYM